MAAGFDTPIHTNDQSVDRVLAAGIPVLLVFLDGRAPDSLDTELRSLARQNQGSLLVALMQAKDNPATRSKYGVHRFPAVAAIRGGTPISQAEGVNAPEVNQHAAYLLGRGPLPEKPPTGPTSSQRSAQTDSQQNASPSRPIPVSESTFENEVFRSTQPVLVDFWAPWCGPCRMTDPILEKLARELAGQLKIAKVNVDENPGISQQYGVQGIPTMMMVKNGKVVDQWVGALSEPALRGKIAPHLPR